MGAHILMIEDDRGIREALSELLGVEGYRVRTASNGEEALSFLKSSGELPELILLDLMMPVMDGWEFRSAQLADPHLAKIPVIVMTADSQAQQRSGEIRADEFIRKPIEIESFLRAISRTLGSTTEPIAS